MKKTKKMVITIEMSDVCNGPFAVFPVAYVSTSIINCVYCAMSLRTHNLLFYQCLVIAYCAVIR